MKKKATILGTLSEAKVHGLSGVVACAGCKSTRGSLEGKTFRCETEGCVYRRKPVVSPWVKRK